MTASTACPEEIAVWLPLPGSSHWRGEGIVQTVENILAKASADESAVSWVLIVGPAHASQITKAVANHPKVTVRTLPGLSGRSRQRQHDLQVVTAYLAKPSPWQIIERGWRKVWSHRPMKGRFELVRYGVMLTIYSCLQSMGVAFRYKYFWLPAPIIPHLALLRGQKTYSFWDPFIFEYATFHSAGFVTMPRFLSHYSAENRIITQSEYNRAYLQEVWNVPAKNIQVINNGTNNYENFRLPIGAHEKPDSVMLDNFGRTTFTGALHQASDRLINQLMAKATLSRLLARRKHLSNSKTLFISTQYRPHKGLDEMLEIASLLVETESSFSYQFVFTATLPDVLMDRYPRLHEHLFQLTRLSNKDHALVYQLADLVIHPSHAEGGGIPYPVHEAASLDTPCLINIGRHTHEAVAAHPALASLTFDISQPETAAQRIRQTLADPEAQAAMLAAAKSCERPWELVANEYVDALINDPQQTIAG